MRIDTKAFRRALGQFPTGVCVMTTLHDNHEPIGVTASSFNSVSMDPPLVLWSVDRQAYSASIFAEAEHFCVNVLCNEQTDVSNRFASQGTEKFAASDWIAGPNGCPQLTDTVACFHCKTWQVYDGGDHVIIVGEVIEFESNDKAEGLVFHKGRYAFAVTQPTQETTAQSLQTDGFVGNYLLYLLRQAYTSYSQDFYPRLNKFGVSAQEWRILTVLADRGEMSMQEIMPLVGQPPAELSITCDTLCEKGYVRTVGASLSLTSPGSELSHQLVDMASRHEAKLIDQIAREVDSQATQSRSTASAHASGSQQATTTTTTTNKPDSAIPTSAATSGEDLKTFLKALLAAL